MTGPVHMRTSPQPEQASDNLRAEKTSTKLGECLGTGPTLRKLSFDVSEIETSTASLLGTPRPNWRSQTHWKYEHKTEGAKLDERRGV